MKNTLLILLVAGFFAHAQNPVLVNTTWYLSSLVQNGISQSPPSDATLPQVQLLFTPDSDGYRFSTYACNGAASDVLVFDDLQNSFTYGMCSFTLGMCALPANDAFDNDYMGYFATNTNLPVTYLIAGSGFDYNLILLSASGDMAVYSSIPLAVYSSEKSLFTVSPNPTSGTIVLAIGNPGQSGEIALWNALGQKVMSQSHDILPESLDISAFESGIYTLEITSGERKSCKKIVKL